MTASIKLEGLFDKARVDTWVKFVTADIRRAVGDGMKKGGRPVLDRVRVAFASSIKLQKKTFPKAIRMRLFDKDKKKLPALWIGSRSPAIAAHALGATIPGPVLIPITAEGKRLGRVRFKKIVNALMSQGEGRFAKVNGKTILFAENLSSLARELAPFRRAERARTGKNRFARNYEFPIAVLVRNVKVPKRFAFESTVRANLDRITDAIQVELNRV